MNVFFYTFGCKVNAVETESLAAQFQEKGFSLSLSPKEADVIVVNSCTVTSAGDNKVRSYLRRVKRERPDAILVLTGCFPEAFPEQAAAVAEADLVIGNFGKQSAAERVLTFARTRSRIVDIPAQERPGVLPHRQLQGFRKHTRAFLKIEDGCDRYCSYCIVPYARGPVRSMLQSDIEAQAHIFSAAGYKEIVLVGINLSSYGKGSACDLADAVAAASAPDGILRVRLSSLEPDLMHPRLIEKLSAEKKLAPHFHIALQSGSDSVLKEMRRRYTAQDFLAVANNIRDHFDAPTFTTDLIVGFPTETTEQFEESLSLVSSFPFLKCHVFPYSVRPGTKAAELPQLDPKEITRRKHRMIETADQIRAAMLSSFVGQKARVILEQQTRAGRMTGYSDRYVPIELRTAASSGDIVDCRITDAEKDRCIAVPID